VTVELRDEGGTEKSTATAASGDYAFDAVAAGPYHVSFALINFAGIWRDVVVSAGTAARVDAALLCDPPL
jgi:hypothetical protein